MGETDIDISITSIWRAWQAFARGKRASPAIVAFRTQLEANLLRLVRDLQANIYCHGGYETFVVHDPKRREIAVAGVRDRVVHRLLYDFLVPIWDRSFCYDAWSCRKAKGLLGAIGRTQSHMHKYRFGWLWRSDITKFFDNVNHATLKRILRTKMTAPVALGLLDEVIASYNCLSISRGLPIGNLTSQIFANIYLNEFDQFVLHSLKPQAYVRYGDDFVLWFPDEASAHAAQLIGTQFLADELRVNVNFKHDCVQPTRQKLAYLGVDIWPTGRRLQNRMTARLEQRLDTTNLASYASLIKHHQPKRHYKKFVYKSIDILEEM